MSEQIDIALRRLLIRRGLFAGKRGAMTGRGNPLFMEQKWQQRWAEDGLYEVKDDDPRPKYYALTMFPYTSGDLHIGHWYAMAPSDVLARYRRMQGFNVLHPMGFDAFGLPAENAAISRGIHPYTWTMDNIEHMRRQLKSIGAIYDWNREVNTCLPDYYKWTQWFFLKLFDAGLAYRAKAPVNWCPRCQTVLANEQVVGDDVCERCETPVERRDMEQWFFRITQYADELLEFGDIDWPERIKIMQRNWIGKSLGTEISFELDHPGVKEKEIRVFTTRPDTTYGVTFMVLAPEHPLVEKLTAAEKKKAVEAYVAKSRRQSEIERLSAEKEKDGVFIGAYCTNRLNGEKVPIWIADYVLLSYGTGAVMAVPAHDERDFAFALKYGLPIIPVINRTDGVAKSYAFPGTVRKGFKEELDKAGFEYAKAVKDGLYVTLHGEKQIRQYTELMKKYLKPDGWNEIVGSAWQFFFAGKNGIETMELDLIASEKKILKRCKALEPNVRKNRTVIEMLNTLEFYRDMLFHDEYGTMIHSGQFSGNKDGINAVSAYLEEKGWGKRTVSYKIRDWLISRQRYWGAPIPIVSCDKCGLVPVPKKDLPVLLPEDAEFKPTGESPLKYNEAFVDTTCPKCGSPAKRETDTMDSFVCSSWYFLRYVSPHLKTAAFDAEKAKAWLPVTFYTGGAEHAVMHLLYVRFFTKAIRDMGLIEFGEPFLKLYNQGHIIFGHQKMSKSRGNVVNPDEYVAELGADVFRAYLMFIGPWEQGGEWDDSGIGGISRWMNRVWNLVLDGYRQTTKGDSQAQTDLTRITHQTIKKVTEDIERAHFNTMVAALMEFTNYLFKAKEVGLVTVDAWQDSIKSLLLLMAPTAPHLAEELWQRTGRDYSIHNQTWPRWDEKLIKEEEITLVVQVNGKVRDKAIVPVSVTEEEAKNIAVKQPKAKTHLAGKKIIKMIYVPGKLVNIVVK